MSTVDSIFVIISAVCLSLFFITATALAIYAWVVFHGIVKRAELALNSVESAGRVIRDVGKSGSALSIFKLLKFISRLSR